MEIKIDEQQIQDVMNAQATSGVKNAFEGYAIKSVLEEAIAKSVIPTLMLEAITKAANEIDIDNLIHALSVQMAKSITVGVQHVIQETMINVILDIKKVPTYDDDKRKAARAEIVNTIFK